MRSYNPAGAAGSYLLALLYAKYFFYTIVFIKVTVLAFLQLASQATG